MRIAIMSVMILIMIIAKMMTIKISAVSAEIFIVIILLSSVTGIGSVSNILQER